MPAFVKITNQYKEPENKHSKQINTKLCENGVSYYGQSRGTVLDRCKGFESVQDSPDPSRVTAHAVTDCQNPELASTRMQIAVWTHLAVVGIAKGSERISTGLHSSSHYSGLSSLNSRMRASQMGARVTGEITL